MIKSLPIEENPREKAIVNGIESLSNVELLALVLRTGNKDESVIQLAQRLLKEIGGISQLSQAGEWHCRTLQWRRAAADLPLVPARY